MGCCRFSEEVVIFCLRVRSLLCLFVKGAYGCILDSRDPFRSFFYLITVVVIISVYGALIQPHFLFLRQGAYGCILADVNQVGAMNVALDGLELIQRMVREMIEELALIHLILLKAD
ncbi:hypothetical protein Tco_0461948 [Tanacetum coccineum]